MTRAGLPLIAALVLVTVPALAVEQTSLLSLPERLAFGIFLVGTILFFGWVAWLTLRR
jgi:hypothetical protein